MIRMTLWSYTTLTDVTAAGVSPTTIRSPTLTEARACSNTIASAFDSYLHSLGRVEDRILTKEDLSVEVALQRRLFQLSRAEDLLAGPEARRAALRRPERPPKSVIEHPEPGI